MTSREMHDHAAGRREIVPTNIPAVQGALLTGTAVALGAFGAHALKASLSAEMLAIFETGVRYQTYHGLGLLALGALPTFQAPEARRATGLLLAGTLVFSGSLYVLSLSGVKWLGAVTPVGGVLLLTGWGLAAWRLYGKGRGTAGKAR